MHLKPFSQFTALLVGLALACAGCTARKTMPINGEVVSGGGYLAKRLAIYRRLLQKHFHEIAGGNLADLCAKSACVGASKSTDCLLVDELNDPERPDSEKARIAVIELIVANAAPWGVAARDANVDFVDEMPKEAGPGDPLGATPESYPKHPIQIAKYAGDQLAQTVTHELGHTFDLAVSIASPLRSRMRNDQLAIADCGTLGECLDYAGSCMGALAHKTEREEEAETETRLAEVTPTPTATPAPLGPAYEDYVVYDGLHLGSSCSSFTQVAGTVVRAFEGRPTCNPGDELLGGSSLEPAGGSTALLRNAPYSANVWSVRWCVRYAPQNQNIVDNNAHPQKSWAQCRRQIR